MNIGASEPGYGIEVYGRRKRRTRCKPIGRCAAISRAARRWRCGGACDRRREMKRLTADFNRDWPDVT
ncbi:hypothetical protein ACQR09_32510, partial [Bradyrhizobium oligotrophicum]